MLTSPKVFQTVQSSRKKAEKEWNNITQWPDSDYSFLWKETVGNLQILGKFSTLTTLNTMTTIHCHRSPISEAEKFKVDSRQRLGLTRWRIQRKVKCDFIVTAFTSIEQKVFLYSYFWVSQKCFHPLQFSKILRYVVDLHLRFSPDAFHPIFEIFTIFHFLGLSRFHEHEGIIVVFSAM